MIHLPWPLIAAIFMAAFGVAGRWSGGGLDWKKLAFDHGGPLHGHPFIYAALPLLAVCAVVSGTVAAVAAALWLIWRGVLGFPDGTITGRNLPATIGRNAQLLVIPAVWAVAAPWHPWPVFIPFLAHVALAVVLAKWNGDKALDTEHAKNINACVELLRDGGFGLALAVALAIGGAP